MTGQLDYILFLYGACSLFMAVVLLSRDPDPGDRLSWGCLIWFGLLQGFHEWLEIAVQVFPGPTTEQLRLGVMGLAFLLLCEFGRRSMKNRSGRFPGIWIYLPLAGAMALLARLEGTDPALRYCLALPGSLGAGMVLLKHARTYTSEWRWPLQIAGVAFFLYAAAAGLIVPAGAFPPASFLNMESFTATDGFSVRVLRAACALAAAGGFYLFYHESTARISRLYTGVLGGSLLLVLVAGFFIMNWSGSARDKIIRERMLAQTSAVARMIDPEYLEALSFSAADRSNPLFILLKQQLASFARAIGTNIYTQALRGGSIVFGPESIPKGDPMASPPGTVYRQPTLENYEAFGTGKPFTEGPVTDEYGTFISAFAPVLDPRSGRVLLLVGMDADALKIRQEIVRARFLALLPIGALVIILFASFFVVSLQQRDPARWKWRLRHVEVVLIAGLGVICAAVLASIVHHFQTKARQTVFFQLAQSQAGVITQSILEISRLQLNNLVRYLANTDRLSPQVFSSLATGLMTDGAVQPLGWAEFIEPGSAHEGPLAAQVTAMPARPALTDGAAPVCPVMYMNPPDTREIEIGYNLAAQPALRAAMEQAARTGTSAASEPVVFGPQRLGQKHIFILRPVFEGASPDRRLRGFAFAVLRPWSLLNKSFSLSGRGSPSVVLGLYQLGPEAQPQLIAASPYPEALQRPLGGAADADGKLEAVFPCFAFGRSYALVVQPGPVFLASNPALGGWLTFLVGTFITVLVSVLIGFLNQRRAYLEVQVQARTAELQQQRQQIEDIIVGTHIGTWRWDLPTGGIMINECWADIVGRRMAELQPLTYEGFRKMVHPEDLARLEQAIQDCLEEKNPLYDCQYRMRRSGGDWIWVQDYGRVMHFSEQGRPLAMSGTHADISEVKESERVLKETLAELKRSNSDLEHFAYVASHDLQEPLRMVVSYMQLLKKRYSGSLDADADDFIGFAVDGAQRMQTLIKDLLAYSRVGTRGKPFAPTDCDDVVLRALENLQVTLAETAAQVEYENLPTVSADESQLVQLFQNLVGNALKYRGPKPPVIRIRAELREQEWLFSVADNGIGIEPRYFERIFVIFQRLHSREEHCGTGIGLAVCKKIIERHGGIIWVDSEPGTGSIFYFTLPAASQQ